jgi:hypothetical protein
MPSLGRVRVVPAGVESGVIVGSVVGVGIEGSGVDCDLEVGSWVGVGPHPVRSAIPATISSARLSITVFPSKVRRKR